MRSSIGWTWLALLLATVSVPANAQLDVTWAGIYTVSQSQRIKDPASPTGYLNQQQGAQLVSATTIVPAELGVKFGIQFRFRDAESAAVEYRYVWRFPSPGLVNPGKGGAIPHTSGTSVCRGTCVRGFTFDEAWELVPGTWTLQIYRDQTKLLEQAFEVRRKPR